jgi:hypothetical protein
VPLAVKSFGIVLIDRPPESKSDSLERFAGSGVPPPISRGLNRFHGQKNGPSGDARVLSEAMDRIRLQYDLEQVDEQLAAVQRQIGRQHQLIWDLDQAKQDTAEAWSLLTELETAQALHITHRDQIIKALKRP